MLSVDIEQDFTLIISHVLNWEWCKSHRFCIWIKRKTKTFYLYTFNSNLFWKKNRNFIKLVSQILNFYSLLLEKSNILRSSKNIIFFFSGKMLNFLHFYILTRCKFAIRSLENYLNLKCWTSLRVWFFPESHISSDFIQLFEIK